MGGLNKLAADKTLCTVAKIQNATANLDCCNEMVDTIRQSAVKKEKKLSRTKMHTLPSLGFKLHNFVH
jgi:hypothetical protein